jgi:AcrR family transcriptional regulator
MSQTMKKPAGTAYDRIVSVATELFYQQGYRATGINEIIEKSGVAKATFYNHFATKEDLCKVYLNGLREKEQNYLASAIAEASNPLDRFFAPIRSVEAWLKETEFRGCPFVNIAAEIPDFNNPLRNEGIRVYNNALSQIKEQCQELVDSDPKRYGHLDVEELSNDYLLLFSGAIAQAEIYNEFWPVSHAEKTIARLIGQ